ncbi:hypothetical protein [Caldithrix abyssi]|uniref:Lipoprotein n=1 Tax=Caldithrix abyssi DSM 13497 TaxID=880073 RepID=A0A1J1C9D7_CALAY|nr:hypothetical protein [Caldithrix abyssi]APF19158.1 hypothetical protein Cabys_2409 [Caldithrix abyssi DSM 13497]
MKFLNPKSGIILALIFLLGCAYYNTFFNAKKYYNQALKKQKNVKSGQKIPGDVKKTIRRPSKNPGS